MKSHKTNQPRKQKKTVTIKAWMIVNKDFINDVARIPDIFVGEVYFSEHKAMYKLEELEKNECGTCGRSDKKRRQLYLRIIPLEISYPIKPK